jgi:hypothetical protein
MTITKDLPTQIEKVRKVVQDYFEKNGVHNLPHYIATGESKEHIVNIGTSILMAKWGIGYPPGGFVQAVVDNDLMRAFANADNVNQHAMRFYTMLMYNVGRPSDV